MMGKGLRSLGARPGRWLLSGLLVVAMQAPVLAGSSDLVKIGAPADSTGVIRGAAASASAAPPARGVRERDRLFGDGRGVHEGLEGGAVYAGEVVRNLVGGIRRRSTYLDNVDLTLSLDLEKVLGWKQTTAFLYGLGNRGGDPSTFIGDAQGSSNIEAADAWKVYEAWIEKRWGEDRVALRIGLYDLNSEFDVKEYGGFFLNSSHGIGADFSQSGLNGPSIFPTTSLGVTIKLQLTPAYYLQAVVLDGVPGGPAHPGIQVKPPVHQGALVTVEGGRRVGEEKGLPYAKWAVGAWSYTARFDALAEVDSQGKPRRTRGNGGLYALAEAQVYREKDAAQGLGLYGRVGFANPRINQFGMLVGGGAVYTGPFARQSDQAGLGLTAVVNGPDYRDTNPGAEAAETNIELSYRLQVFPWLAVQPDFQYILNPGTDPALDNAAVLTCRFETSF